MAEVYTNVRDGKSGLLATDLNLAGQFSKCPMLPNEPLRLGLGRFDNPTHVNPFIWNSSGTPTKVKGQVAQEALRF